MNNWCTNIIVSINRMGYNIRCSFQRQIYGGKGSVVGILPVGTIDMGNGKGGSSFSVVNLE